MAADSIANATDTELLAIVDQLRTALVTHASDYPSITVAMKADLDTLRDSFNDKIAAHSLAQATAKSATSDKNSKRSEVEKAVRDIRNIIKASGVDDTKMAALGIPVSSNKSPTNATVPVAQVDTSKRMQHTISWIEATTPDNKKRPRGSMGAEIWVKLGDPAPGNEKDCSFLTLDSATPYLAEYDASDAGKIAHYMIRWRMQDGSTGAWGETVSATITA